MSKKLFFYVVCLCLGFSSMAMDPSSDDSIVIINNDDNQNSSNLSSFPSYDESGMQSESMNQIGGYQNIDNQKAVQIVELLYGDGQDHKELVQILNNELPAYPNLLDDKKHEKKGKVGDNEKNKLLVTGQFLAHLAVKMHDEKNKNGKEITRQKEKVKEKKDEIQNLKDKDFWKTVSAVGSAGAAVASIIWNIVGQTTGDSAQQILFEVLCNCTSAVS